MNLSKDEKRVVKALLKDYLIYQEREKEEMREKHREHQNWGLQGRLIEERISQVEGFIKKLGKESRDID